MCYPKDLKKAQAKIDSVVKPGQLPDISDRDSLPYLSVLIKEILQWNTVFLVGVPRCLETNDIYKGYLIFMSS
ncbi:hypothetical protein AX16_000933 [Volvariella volvacea WC 439]|nr:hypothetical protein AX16_000933 [Volvariella volvacea WC 439]